MCDYLIYDCDCLICDCDCLTYDSACLICDCDCLIHKAEARKQSEIEEILETLAEIHLSINPLDTSKRLS